MAIRDSMLLSPDEITVILESKFVKKLATLFFFIDGYLVQGPPGTYQAKRASIHVTLRMRASINNEKTQQSYQQKHILKR